MTTVRELKARKEVQVTRVDNNFINNTDIINSFEEQAKQNNYEVLEKKLNDNYMEYVLINPNEEDIIKYYVKDNNSINDILSKQTQPIIKHEVKEEFLYITVKGRKVYFNLRLNKSYMKKQLQGKLVFRSKDYYFEFTDEENKVQKFYSSHDLKANMIKDNKIVIEEYGLEYILN